MDRKLVDLKRLYENPTIPDELSDRIQAALSQKQSDVHQMGQEKKHMVRGKENKKLRYIKRTAAAAIALVILTGGFAVSVNTVPSFADSIKDVPVLGSLAKVFTVDEVKKDDSVAKIDMKIPAVEGIKDAAFEKQINSEIKKKMTEVADSTRKQAAQNKKSWLENGGKESEYTPAIITLDYRVKGISKDILSFLVFQTSNTASYYENQYYYNIDLKHNRELTLKDLLGDDYIQIANEQIKAQIAERSKDPNNQYFDGSEDTPGFTTITKNQNFYVNDKGHPVIVFNKYDIAPGYMGIQEFEITK